MSDVKVRSYAMTGQDRLKNSDVGLAPGYFDTGCICDGAWCTVHGEGWRRDADQNPGKTVNEAERIIRSNGKVM